MNKSIAWLSAFFILIFGIALAFGQNVSEEAKMHFDRGMAAIEMAKAPSDFVAAIKEFEQAVKLAPNWSDAFYNLGVAQEGSERFAAAALSYRQYLRLAPDAEDAEEIKSLINKLEYKAIPELPIAKGFMGIPWGASREHVNEAMNGQGYQNRFSVPGIVFSTDLVGAPLKIHFEYFNDILYKVWSQGDVITTSQQLTHNSFIGMSQKFSKEYGPPDSYISETFRANDGVNDPHESNTWNLVDEKSGDEYIIRIEFSVTWYPFLFEGYQGRCYCIDTHYEAASLRERLKNKGAGITLRKPTASKPPELSPEQIEISETLFCAAENGNKEAAERAIAKGADINATDNDGDTPLKIAEDNGFKEIADLLKKHGNR